MLGEFCIMEQMSLFSITVKKTKKNVPKNKKIKDNLLEWNTIKHVYRYQTLYKLYQKLFNLTYQKKLLCLNYYIDTELNGDITHTLMYAEIKNSFDLSLEERVLLHIDLLRKIQNNDNNLVYGDSEIISDNQTLLI